MTASLSSFTAFKQSLVGFPRAAYLHIENTTNRQSASTDIEEKTMNPVVHFEMPYDDRKRMAQFYESAFGWQTQLLDEDMGNYVLATATETDEKGPQKPGAINGGFFPKKPDWPAQHPSIVIAVEDIKDAVRRV